MAKSPTVLTTTVPSPVVSWKDWLDAADFSSCRNPGCKLFSARDV